MLGGFPLSTTTSFAAGDDGLALSHTLPPSPLPSQIFDVSNNNLEGHVPDWAACSKDLTCIASNNSNLECQVPNCARRVWLSLLLG